MTEQANAESRQRDILVVDDTTANLRLLDGLLRSNGYRVRPVPSGELALRAVEAAVPDIILLDMNLPDIAGIEVCRRIKTRAHLQHVPIIFISALAETEDKIAAFAAGGIDYVTKPFRTEEVLARVRTHLALRDMREQIEQQNRALAESRDTLEARVRERTRELEHANSELQAQINERQRAERELRLNAGVFHGTSESILICSASHQVMRVNRSLLLTTGYQESEIIGKPMAMLMGQHQAQAFYQAVEAQVQGTGHWQGELFLRRKNGEVFPVWLSVTGQVADEDHPAQAIVTFSDISEKKLTEQRLHRLAHYDPLTDLPNRLLFNEYGARAIARAKREGSALAVLVIDLDGFKHINDSLGHPVGDEVLRQAAERLARGLRDEDTIARPGGDEFLVIAERLNSPAADAAKVARKLLEVFAQPFHAGGQELHLTASIGISVFPADAADMMELMKNADAALYRAKHGGRNMYQFYTSELTAAASERVKLEAQLNRAIQQDELLVHYQPQFDLGTGELVGAEALARWRHPDMGLIPPLRFIPVAEETGLIVPLGERILRKACEQVQAWRQQGLMLSKISVNIAGQQIQQQEIVDTVRRVLEETGLPAELLELEVTETFIMQNATRAIETLNALRALGISLAIDDFGTGYSSLSYLKRLPIQTLKIDRSFVRDIPVDANDTAITRAMLALAGSLGLRTVAEGVETEQQRDFLAGERCELVQGYLYSPPLAPEDFWLRYGADLA